MRRAAIEVATGPDGVQYINSLRPGQGLDTIRELQKLATERAKVEARIAVTVQELRQAGASWSVVGHALGCTRSAAQKRYGRDELAL